MEDIADKLLVQIKEEPLDYEVHTEQLFIREEHYEFHDLPIDQSTSTTINQNVNQKEKQQRKQSNCSEDEKDTQDIPIIKKENESTEAEETDYIEEAFKEIDKDNRPKHQCNICKKEFPRKAHMLRHIKIHLTGKERRRKGQPPISTDKVIVKFGDIEFDRSTFKKFECHLCDKNFTRHDILKRHIRTKHPESGDAPYEIRFTCEVCKKYFKSKEYLDLHSRMHEGMNPYACEFCEKDLKDLSHLKEHLRIHTGEKPFKCEPCDLSFMRNVALKKHREDVHGESGLLPKRPESSNIVHKILCSFCGKDFTRVDSLRAHLVAHTGEKPYVCDLCGRAFAYKKSLIEHNRIHTGERPFECEFCPKNYIRKYDLTLHIQNHHGGLRPSEQDNDQIQFSCGTCSKVFRLKASLTKHKKFCKGNVNIVVQEDIGNNSQINNEFQ